MSDPVFETLVKDNMSFGQVLRVFEQEINRIREENKMLARALDVANIHIAGLVDDIAATKRMVYNLEKTVLGDESEDE